MYRLRIHPSSPQICGRAVPHKAHPQEGNSPLRPGPGPSIFPARWVTLTELRMVECPLDVLRWAEELHRVEARCILSYRPPPIESMC
jgi:hypothetical protein